MTLRRVLAGAGAVVVVSLGLWSFWLEPSSTTIKTERMDLPGWPAACEGLRIVVLADLHVGSPHKGAESLDGLVAAVNRLNADLVLLAGDYVMQGVLGGTFVSPERIADLLGGLDAPLGVHAVLGNHDWSVDGPRVTAAFETVGITVFEDRSQVLRAGSCRFNLAGLSDYMEGARQYEAALGSTDPDLPVIAFTHNPDPFAELTGRFDLLIAGHTHGGQVNLPFVGRLVVPSGYGQRYAIGLIRENGRSLYVNPGIGTSIIPVRFRVPPEISVLEIHAMSGSPPEDAVASDVH